MNLWRHRYRAWIVPYAEGTLDAGRRAKLEAWLARDPVLAAEAEAERRVVARLRAAAQSSGPAPGEKNLWPGIASRLEPRRNLVRPLILVGGLSAAATSLAWATLWGPLGHPVPPSPVVMVANPGASNVIVVGPPSARRHGHLGRRPRHGGRGSKASTEAHVKPEPSTEDRPPGSQDDGLLARNGDTPPTVGGNAPAASEVVPGTTSHFHLAANVRPAGHAGTQGAAPAALDNSSAPGDADASNQDSAPTDAGDGSAPAQNGAADAAPEKAPGRRVPRRAQRHHRRHAHPTRRARPDADRQAPKTTPDAVAPTGTADLHPGVKGKPVD